jgi:hypothetical protein
MTFLVGAESQTLTMDQLTVSLQQARALSFLSQSLQVISQFAVLLMDDDDDRQKRKKTFLQQRCQWPRKLLVGTEWHSRCGLEEEHSRSKP